MNDPLSQAAATALIHDHHWTPTPVTKPEDDWKLNPKKEGDGADDCPNPDCGERDAPLKFKSGGRTSKGEEYRDWAIFQCPCCSTSWSRTTKQGLAADAARGVHTRHPDAAAATGRVISYPSRRFISNYDRIDWSR